MFDPTCKFLAESFPADFTTWLLGEPVSLTKISPTELSLEPIRADSLILWGSDSPILQIEFQTAPDPKRVVSNGKLPIEDLSPLLSE